jgi:hypothetical protein
LSNKTQETLVVFKVLFTHKNSQVNSKTTTMAATTTKAPYWAGTEVSAKSQTTQPQAAHGISRKPGGAGHNTHTTSRTSTSPAARIILRKPVATVPASSPGWKYNAVEGNPYAQDATQQWIPASGSANKQRGTSPSHISTEKANGFQQNFFDGAHHQQVPLSPGQLLSNGMTKATDALSRGMESVRRAASQAKRALSVSHEPKISSPVPGSFQRGDRAGYVLESQEDILPLHLVGLEVAQANVRQFGQADYALADAKGDPRAVAMSMLTGDPMAPQPSSNSETPALPAPATPAPPKSKRTARKVVGQSGRDTVFGDILDAGYDSSWTSEPEALAQSDGKGKGRAGSRTPSAMPASFRPVPTGGNPFAVRRDSARMAPVNLDRSLPSSPAPGSLRRCTSHFPQTWASQASQARTSRTGTAKSSLAETLKADGVQRASYVGGIKCTNCGKVVDACAANDHRCSQRAAQAVDNESQPTGFSRANAYAANFGNQDWSKDDDPEVVVDTFVHNGYTSWKGIVRAEGGGSKKSLQGRVGGGSEGVRRSNEAG